MLTPGVGLGSALTPFGVTTSEGHARTFEGQLTETVGCASLLSASLTGVLTQSVGIASAAALGDTFFAELAVVIELSPVTDAGHARGAEVTDTFRAQELSGVIRARNAPLELTIGVEPLTDVLRGIIVRDTVGVDETLDPTTTYGVLLQQLITLRSSLGTQIPVEMADNVGLAVALTTHSAVTVADELGVLPALLASASLNGTITEGVGIDPALLRFFGADVVEELGVDPALLGVSLRRGIISEDVGIEPLETPQLVLRATVDEGVGIEPLEALGMLFAAEVVEGVELTAAYLAPNGSFTTWAMNTRTGAVSEYADFAFNSFAQIGNTYLGASSAGLYELRGDDDDGADIIARIKSGFMQFGGTRLSRLKSAYIAARGEGAFVLRIIDGEDRQYDYAVDTRNQRSTKVHMGKGQRARYFAFELISEGQDFDLDTLEFVPIVVERRV
jgi:hypothetical protein